MAIPFPEVSVEQYNSCFKYFLDVELNGIISELNADEKNQFFKMITEYPALLDKLFFVKGAPFTNYVIYGNEFYEALADHHDDIDYTPSWIVSEYKEWLVNNKMPFPEDKAVKDGLDFTPMLNFQAKMAELTK